eukprot:TRINITY_DN39897_c0_g1_i2.p1 TRINITY_DN39897_c0_g1~~TRINITY_DN39897_c0_g1_i2.p1  ORF type:complete len:1281 (+),score=173.59 TRINITY_DN39897_c0_g1_i2:123-3965(+)
MAFAPPRRHPSRPNSASRRSGSIGPEAAAPSPIGARGVGGPSGGYRSQTPTPRADLRRRSSKDYSSGPDTSAFVVSGSSAYAAPLRSRRGYPAAPPAYCRTTSDYSDSGISTSPATASLASTRVSESSKPREGLPPSAAGYPRVFETPKGRQHAQEDTPISKEADRDCVPLSDLSPCTPPTLATTTAASEMTPPPNHSVGGGWESRWKGSTSAPPAHASSDDTSDSRVVVCNGHGDAWSARIARLQRIGVKVAAVTGTDDLYDDDEVVATTNGVTIATTASAKVMPTDDRIAAPPAVAQQVQQETPQEAYCRPPALPDRERTSPSDNRMESTADNDLAGDMKAIHVQPRAESTGMLLESEQKASAELSGRFGVFPAAGALEVDPAQQCVTPPKEPGGGAHSAEDAPAAMARESPPLLLLQQEVSSCADEASVAWQPSRFPAQPSTGADTVLAGGSSPVAASQLSRVEQSAQQEWEAFMEQARREVEQRARAKKELLRQAAEKAQVDLPAEAAAPLEEHAPAPPDEPCPPTPVSNGCPAADEFTALPPTAALEGWVASGPEVPEVWPRSYGYGCSDGQEQGGIEQEILAAAEAVAAAPPPLPDHSELPADTWRDALDDNDNEQLQGTCEESGYADNQSAVPPPEPLEEHTQVPAGSPPQSPCGVLVAAPTPQSPRGLRFPEGEKQHHDHMHDQQRHSSAVADHRVPAKHRPESHEVQQSSSPPHQHPLLADGVRKPGWLSQEILRACLVDADATRDRTRIPQQQPCSVTERPAIQQHREQQGCQDTVTSPTQSLRCDELQTGRSRDAAAAVQSPQPLGHEDVVRGQNHDRSVVSTPQSNRLTLRACLEQNLDSGEVPLPNAGSLDHTSSRADAGIGHAAEVWAVNDAEDSQQPVACPQKHCATPSAPPQQQAVAALETSPNAGSSTSVSPLAVTGKAAREPGPRPPPPSARPPTAASSSSASGSGQQGRERLYSASPSRRDLPQATNRPPISPAPEAPSQVLEDGSTLEGLSSLSIQGRRPSESQLPRTPVAPLPLSARSLAATASSISSEPSSQSARPATGPAPFPQRSPAPSSGSPRVAAARQARIRELLQRLHDSSSLTAQFACPFEAARVAARQRQAVQRHVHSASQPRQYSPSPSHISGRRSGGYGYVGGSPMASPMPSRPSSASASRPGSADPARRSRSIMDLVSGGGPEVPGAELLGRSERIPPAILDRMLAQLPAVMVKTGEEDPCIICLERPTRGEVMLCLPCCHRYHRDCIKEWLKHSRLCPLCKAAWSPD